MKSTGTDEQQLKTLAPGLMREVLHGGQLVIYSMSMADDEAQAACVEDGRALLASWPTERPLYLMFDLSHDGIVLTPLFRQRLQELTALCAERELHGACVFALPPQMPDVVFALNARELRQGGGRVEHQVFTRREDAMDWLHQRMET